jgi:NhaC family Na+:H+ antiporter
MKLITPGSFILLTFALCSLLSYAIGTSFGVAGTMGVIFMAIARSGGANEILTAGAVMSGIYFGDCCSPAASSMALTAAMCRTDAYAHSRRLLKANLLPMGLCVVLYGALSPLFPLGSVDTPAHVRHKKRISACPGG